MGSGDGDRRFGGGVGLRRLGPVVGAVVSVAAVAIGLSWVRPVSTAGAPTSVEEVRPAVDPTTSTEPPAAPGAQVWPGAAVQVEGTEVQRGNKHWSGGEPGDLVAVGDWDCDGVPTPAVVRPSVGRLFVFSSWADAGEAVAGPPVPEDVVTFVAKGCGRGEVRTASGALSEVETVEDR